MGMFDIFKKGEEPPRTAETERKMTTDEQVSFVDNEFKRRRDERRPFELQWRMNIAFLEGNQFVDINPVALDLQEIPPLYEWQEREAFNQIAPAVELRIAKLNRMRPILKTRPGTNEQEDIRAAKVGTALLRNIYYEQGITNMITEFLSWMESCGSVLSKNVWDSTKGPLVGYATDQEIEDAGQFGGEMAQMQSMMGQQMMPGQEGMEMNTDGMDEIREGDLDVLIVPPQEIFPDSSYRQNVSNCRSMIHARSYHIDEIYDIWGIKVSPEPTTVLQLQRSMVGTGGLGYGLGGFQFNSTALKDSALVKEYWEAPTRRYKNGRLLTIIRGKLVNSDSLPYPVGDDGKPALPFCKADCIERAGLFWGKSVVERLIPVQRRYNAIKNRKAEFMNRVSIGGFWVTKDSVDIDVMEQEVGAPGFIGEVEFGKNYPQPIQNGSWPSAFDNDENACLNEINALSGVSDLSKLSKAPPGVKSGVALGVAAEQDDTRLSTTAGNIEVFLTENGKQWLRLYKHYASGVRTLREIGENNVIELIDWTGADIKSDDVIIEPVSMQLESPGQRRQFVFDLLSAGLMNDPDTGRISKEMRSKIFEMIQLGNWESADGDTQLHSSKAERENLMFTNGQFSPPAVYDDHMLHIQKHNNFRLTTDYEEIMAQMPLIEMIFQQHVMLHMAHMMPQPMQGQPQGQPQIEQQARTPAIM